MSLGSIAVKSPLRIWYADEVNLPATAVRQAGPISIAAYPNGRLRGNVHVDTVGVLVVKQELYRGSGDLQWTVAQDLTQPDFQFPFDIFVVLPFVTLEWTQGGAPATFFRAYATVMPV